MNRSIALLIIGLVFGGLAGFVTAAANNVTLDGHDHGAHLTGAAGGGHDHAETLSLAEGPGAPTLEIALMPDPVSGWNLHLDVTNFAFAPEHAGGAHVPGEGHAHVYADGVKLARLYGPWAHLTGLAAGTAIEVTLNSNDHRTLAVGETPLAARVTMPD